MTQIICDKEKKLFSYKLAKLDALSNETVVKIKKFTEKYIVKVLRELETSGKHPRPLLSAMTQATASMSTNTTSSADRVDVVMADMTVNEAVGVDPDPDSDAEGEDKEDIVMDRRTNEPGVQSAFLKLTPLEPPMPPDSAIIHPMEVDDQTDSSSRLADPRRRQPVQSLIGFCKSWLGA